MQNLTALVVDDHPLVARGIADFMQSVCRFNTVYVTHNVEGMQQLIAQHDYFSLFVIDFWLPNGESLDLILQLKSLFPDTPILITSADDNPVVIRKAREYGADGFIHKQHPTESFTKAVESLLKGLKWFDGSEMNEVKSPQPKELPISIQELGLTPRQGQILQLILKGLPNKRIAQSLDLTEPTVKEHVSAILNRLGVSNRIQVITMLRGRKVTLVND
jgi:DNA-binding NarL/FixJ family response regulator